MNRLGTLSKALLSQVIAMALVLGLMAIGALGQTPSLWILVASQAVLACGSAWLLRSDAWWLWIHGLFPVAVALANTLEIHSGWYLAAFIVLVLIFGPTVRNRVPLYLSNQQTVQAVSDLLSAEIFKSGPSVSVLDIGSGTGTMTISLARLHPEHQFDGIEGAWMPYLISKMKALGLANTRLIHGDFWRHSLAPYPAVYAFLSTEPMPRLWQKACSEMQPGSVLISNSFQVPGVTPERVLQVDDGRQTELLVYRITRDGR